MLLKKPRILCDERVDHINRRTGDADDRLIHGWKRNRKPKDNCDKRDDPSD
jgi:hypothetical protein